MTSRIEMLEQYYREDPDDPFNAYALALEYWKTDIEKANTFFDLLLRKHPEYTPVYYHAGKLYQQRGKIDQAISIFQKGIVQAKSVNDMKAARELKSALDELIFDED